MNNEAINFDLSSQCHNYSSTLSVAVQFNAKVQQKRKTKKKFFLGYRDIQQRNCRASLRLSTSDDVKKNFD